MPTYLASDTMQTFPVLVRQLYVNLQPDRRKGRALEVVYDLRWHLLILYTGHAQNKTKILFCCLCRRPLLLMITRSRLFYIYIYIYANVYSFPNEKLTHLTPAALSQET